MNKFHLQEAVWMSVYMGIQSNWKRKTPRLSVQLKFCWIGQCLTKCLNVNVILFYIFVQRKDLTFTFWEKTITASGLLNKISLQNIYQVMFLKRI